MKDILATAEEKATQANATKVSEALPILTALQSTPPCLPPTSLSLALAPGQLDHLVDMIFHG